MLCRVPACNISSSLPDLRTVNHSIWTVCVVRCQVWICNSPKVMQRHCLLCLEKPSFEVEYIFSILISNC